MTIDQLRKSLTGNAESPRRCCYSKAKRFEAFLANQLSRMGRVVHTHIYSYSALMIVHEIDVDGVFTFEIKDHPPVSRHRDSPLTSSLALKRMKSKTRQCHPIRSSTVVKCRKNAPQSKDVLRRNTPCASLDKQPFQTLVSEAPDHGHL